MPPTDEQGSLGPDYFDAVYAWSDDPWSFETSAYEHAKYADTLAALPRPRYASALEVGCSIGVLTRMLAGRCERLQSVDVAERALERARARCADLPHVRFERRVLPDAFPFATFDLVVLSEVGYYWSPTDLRRTLDLCAEGLTPGGDLLLVHWTPPVDDYPLTGDQVHEIALGHPGFRHAHGHRRPQYRLDLLTRLEHDDAPNLGLPSGLDA
jgi:SAM-dependent methyltransferase